MPRDYTCKLLELAEEGSIDWESIARECLNRMSEDDVKDMAIEMDWLPDCDDDYGC